MPEGCPREPHVLAALRNARGESGAIRKAAVGEHAAHLATCSSCALAADAERWLLAAAASLVPTRVPSPGGLILRARLRARREAADRSLRPLEIWRATALVAGGLMMATLGTGPFLDGLWTRTTPAQALFALGALVLAGLPIWLRGPAGTGREPGA